MSNFQCYTLKLKGSFLVMQDSFEYETYFFKNILLTYVLEKNVYLPEGQILYSLQSMLNSETV